MIENFAFIVYTVELLLTVTVGTWVVMDNRIDG